MYIRVMCLMAYGACFDVEWRESMNVILTFEEIYQNYVRGKEDLSEIKPRMIMFLPDMEERVVYGWKGVVKQFVMYCTEGFLNSKKGKFKEFLHSRDVVLDNLRYSAGDMVSCVSISSTDIKTKTDYYIHVLHGKRLLLAFTYQAMSHCNMQAKHTLITCELMNRNDVDDGLQRLNEKEQEQVCKEQELDYRAQELVHREQELNYKVQEQVRKEQELDYKEALLKTREEALEKNKSELDKRKEKLDNIDKAQNARQKELNNIEKAQSVERKNNYENAKYNDERQLLLGDESKKLSAR